jgi:hypothetical protein
MSIHVFAPISSITCNMYRVSQKFAHSLTAYNSHAFVCLFLKNIIVAESVSTIFWDTLYIGAKNISNKLCTEKLNTFYAR